MTFELRALPTRMLGNYVRRYEEEGVQPTPRLRFLDGACLACPAAALYGARDAIGLARATETYPFRGSPLEAISRAFEDGRLSPHALYAECLLELARRAPARTPAPSGAPATV